MERKRLEKRVQKNVSEDKGDNWLRWELIGFVFIKICVLAVLWGAVVRDTTVKVDGKAMAQRLVSVSSPSEQGGVRGH
jgi:hypothetical protein